jgi:VWFA-related protein
MSSLPSGAARRVSENFPNSWKQSLVIFAGSAALILISWTAALRAAPQTQAPPPPAARQQTPSSDSVTPQASRPALRVVQQMVQVDIIAKDANGKPVQNLKQSDFTVYDNGRRQDISFFSMETDQTRNLPRPQLAPGTYSNLIEQKQGVPGNLTILLLDYLNTQHSDMAFAKDRVIKLLHEMKPEDRVAVYVLSRRLYVLHDFTSDMTALTQSVKKYDTVESADTANSSAFTPAITQNIGDDQFVNQASQDMSDAANVDRVSTTVNIFEIIAQHMVRLPGRKNLVWVSGSFPININLEKMENSTNDAYSSPATPMESIATYGVQPNSHNHSEGLSLSDRRNFVDDLARATRALATANIALYPVDPRGLIGAFGAGGRTTLVSGGLPLPGAASGPNMWAQPGALYELAPNFETMKTLAEQTGGVAYYNNSDIGGEVRQAMEDSRVSYMLAFYPGADDGKGRFHNIKVRIDRPGVELRYRTGYTPKPLNFSGVVDNSAIEREVMGSPLDATGLGMTVRTSSVHGAATPTVSLTINLEENDVSFKFDDERDTGQIEVLLVQYDTEGNAIWVETSKVKMRLVRDMYAKVRKEGLQFGRNLPLKPGAVELKVIACDDKSSSIGSVSIPLAAYLPAAANQP